MALDDRNPITPLESATIRNALLAMAPQVVNLVAQVTGKAFDVDFIKDFIANGYDIGFTLLTLYFIARTIRARINATETITTKPKG